jgi:hypothetical protein
MCITKVVFKNEDNTTREDSKLSSISLAVVTAEMTWIDLFSQLTLQLRRNDAGVGILQINFNNCNRWSLGNYDLLKIGKEIIDAIEINKTPLEIIVVSTRYHHRF